MTKTIDISEAQSDLPELLDYTRSGNDVIIAKDNVPIARLTGVHQASGGTVRIAGLHKGMTWVSDDFDQPLEDSFWLGEQ